jgi:hypothetical protein
MAELHRMSILHDYLLFYVLLHRRKPPADYASFLSTSSETPGWLRFVPLYITTLRSSLHHHGWCREERSVISRGFPTMVLLENPSPLSVVGCKIWVYAQGLWAGRGLYRATTAVIRDPGVSGLFRRTAPFSRRLRQARGCWGPFLT